MRLSRSKALFSVACLLLATHSLQQAEAQTSDTSDMKESCRAFVQGFYDWYVPVAHAETKKQPAWDIALNKKGDSFAQALSRALRKEDAIHSKLQDAGLDEDPFLNSQDPGERYVVGDARMTGDHCSADVYGIYSGRRSGKPEVVPELTLLNEKWIFVNFRYQSSDLLGLLKSLGKREFMAPARNDDSQPVRPKPQ